MYDAILLAGDRYHKADDAFAGVGPALESAGWAYEYGKGRVAYLANGHTLEILRHAMVQRLLHNTAKWLAPTGSGEH
ncbi:MAG: ThuA domain-containing protein [Chloroflexi bacterium]|nr:ThuA domain-containing protein [Chloroflexota bacterium]MCL5275176.1 ThuA domain-containing protein [Chloroflexota bacterium]